MRQEDHLHVPMPGRPGAVFVMVQSEFGFVFLKTAFNGPARAADTHQLAHRGLLWSVAQGVFNLAVGIVAQQQPAFALRRPIRAQINPGPRESCYQWPFCALGDFVGLPVPERLDLEQLFYRAAFGLEGPPGGARFGPDFSGAGDVRQVIAQLDMEETLEAADAPAPIPDDSF